MVNCCLSRHHLRNVFNIADGQTFQLHGSRKQNEAKNLQSNENGLCGVPFGCDFHQLGQLNFSNATWKALGLHGLKNPDNVTETIGESNNVHTVVYPEQPGLQLQGIWPRGHIKIYTNKVQLQSLKNMQCLILNLFWTKGRLQHVQLYQFLLHEIHTNTCCAHAKINCE